MPQEKVLACPRSGSERESNGSRRLPEQGLTTPRTQGVAGENPTPQDSLRWWHIFYGLDPLKGVEGVSPLPPKSGSVSAPPFILTDTANLDSLKCLPFNEPRTCTPKYIVLKCACGRQIVPSTCMGLDCVTCRDHVVKRRSGAVFQRLLQSTLYQHNQNTSKTHNQSRNGTRKTVIYTVFTVPPSLRQRYLNPKEWSKLRRKVWKLLKSDFGGLYGMEASHPVGDEDPHLFHPHLNFLWVQREGWRSFLDLDALRLKYSRLLNIDTVDVHTRYSDNVRQIKHWCNYTCRTFPGNHKWTGPIRWYGKYPHIQRVVEVTCPECGQHFRRIGIISKVLVDQYYETGWELGLDPPWYDDTLIVPSTRRC